MENTSQQILNIKKNKDELTNKKRKKNQLTFNVFAEWC